MTPKGSSAQANSGATAASAAHVDPPAGAALPSAATEAAPATLTYAERLQARLDRQAEDADYAALRERAAMPYDQYWQPDALRKQLIGDALLAADLGLRIVKDEA